MERPRIENHTEPLAHGQRGQDPGFRDAEHRPVRLFTQRGQAGVGIAGNHEGRGTFLKLGGKAQQRPDDQIDISLSLNPRGAFVQGMGHDWRHDSSAHRIDGPVDCPSYLFKTVGVDHMDRHGASPSAGGPVSS